MWLIGKKKSCKHQGLGIRVQDLEGHEKSDSYFLFPSPYPLSPKKGFTLIEILVATSILGVIGLTILTTFASGLHVFERVQAFGGVQSDVLLAFEEMERDIKNIFPFSTIAFEGSTQSIAFPAVIETSELIDGKEELVSTIGRVSYYIDDATYIGDREKGLMRAVQNYSQAVAGEEVAEDQNDYLTPLEDLSFEYYYFDEEAETYGWQGSWSGEDETLLSGIKIVMTYKDGDRDVEVERTVIIPAIQKIFAIEQEEEEGEEEGEEGEGE